MKLEEMNKLTLADFHKMTHDQLRYFPKRKAWPEADESVKAAHAEALELSRLTKQQDAEWRRKQYSKKYSDYSQDYHGNRKIARAIHRKNKK